MPATVRRSLVAVVASTLLLARDLSHRCGSTGGDTGAVEIEVYR